MIADRPYMRKDDSGPRWSPTIVILVLNVLVFFLEYADGPRSEAKFMQFGALSLEGLQHWYLWQFLTFQFLHGGLPHLLINGFVLFSFGRSLEKALGKSTFLKLYLLSGFAGGVLQVLLALIWPQFGGPMVGASAGICGLIAAFALLSPDSTIYLFMVLPVRARYFLPLMILLPVVFLAFGASDGIAHAAHLGGTLFGFAYLRWLRGLEGFAAFWQRLLPRRRSKPIVKVRFPKAGSSWEPESGAAPNSGEGDFISKEVDPILEKISAHGIQSLTPREREILERARARIRK